MKRGLKYIIKGLWFAAIVVASVFVVTGCAEESDENLDQRDLIITYLEGSHSPLLIPEEDLSSSLESEPHFYSTVGDYALRYISTFYDSGRDQLAEIGWSSKVTLTFELYPTTNGSVSSGTLPTYTNNSAYESYYIANGLNVTYWDFTPLEFTVGSGTFMDGIEQSLVGCRMGDVIYIYITRNMAYGNNVIGLIDEGSAILFSCIIEGVEN